MLNFWISLNETWNIMRNYIGHIWVILLKTEIWEVWEKLELLWEVTGTLEFLWTTEIWEIWKTLEIWRETYYYCRIWAIWEKLNLLWETVFNNLKKFMENWNFW